jgi:tetratricopeptide (TPR) repeat protein
MSVVLWGPTPTFTKRANGGGFAYHARTAMRRLGFLFFSVAIAISAPVEAQDYAQARILFERGNERFEQAMRARGERKRTLMNEALDLYLQSYGIAPSRNVAFNAAVSLEELGRLDEAFAFFTEYLEFDDLGEDEQATGRQRRDALRPRVAIVSVTTEPAGAEVRVGRRDVAPSGTTPVEIAVPEGDRTLVLSLGGYRDAEIPVTAFVGQSVEAHAALVPRPRPVRIQAPSGGRLTIDGQVINPGEIVEVEPGEHRIRYEPAFEQTIIIRPGETMQEIQLPIGRAGTNLLGNLRLSINRPARVFIDGALQGEGARLDLELEAGPRLLRVESAGFARAESRVDVPALRHTAVDVTLEPLASGSSLGVLPEVAWATAGTAGIASASFALYAFALRNDFEEANELPPQSEEEAAERQDLYDRYRDMNAVADYVFVGAAGLAVVALVLSLLDEDDESRPSTIRIGASTAGVAAEVPLP